MKAIRVEDGKPQWVDVPMPEGDGVRVDVVSSSICGSDLHMVNAGMVEGLILGHEFAGTTPDGTAVAVEPLISCGECHACDAGNRPHCESGTSFMGVSLQGGMAETVVVPEASLVKLPAGADLRSASLVEPLAVAVNGIDRARIASGDRVLIIGAGPIGLAVAAVLQARGVKADMSARHPHQQAAAEQLGASLDVGDGYDIVMDAVGTTASIADAVTRLRPRGRVGLVGTPWEPAAIDMGACMREIEIVTAMMYGGNPPNRAFDEAARIVATNSEVATAMISHRFPLEAASEAFAAAANRAAGAIKVVFDV
ncbi:MAG: alcohol dehydrogenase catalytic domain-containing protein [Myxococcota bacterium]|nr:alcohol dehydrogenase catalytic domain-containing protein [Myxococcota bacterium]